MMTKRSHLLANILRAVVDEYGHDEVVRTLTRLPFTENNVGLSFETRRQPGQDNNRHRDTAKTKRPSAVDQATKLASETQEPNALMALAARFDRKEFLPSSADVREFLSMMGKNEGVKDRVEGFRYILPILVKLPPERLKRLADSASHSGPAQLGPLADAIRSAGAAMRRWNKEPDADIQPKPLDVNPTTEAQDTKEGEASPSGSPKALIAVSEAVEVEPAKSGD